MCTLFLFEKKLKQEKFKRQMPARKCQPITYIPHLRGRFYQKLHGRKIIPL
jgi:hypothetical protein